MMAQMNQTNYGKGTLPIPSFFEVDYQRDMEHADEVLERLVARNPRGLKQKDIYGLNPLYYAISTHAPLTWLRILLSFVSNKNAESDTEMKSALIWALEFGSAVSVIQLLLTMNPELAIEGSLSTDMTALHYALQYHAHDEVLEELLLCYPGSIAAQDKDGYLPLHLGCRNRTPFFQLKHLLERFPEAVNVPVKGQLPLHMAIESRCDYEIIDQLLVAYPEAVRLKDAKGRLAIHSNFEYFSPLVGVAKMWSHCQLSLAAHLSAEATSLAISNSSVTFEKAGKSSMYYIPVPSPQFAAMIFIEKASDGSVQSIGLSTGRPSNTTGCPVFRGKGATINSYYCGRSLAQCGIADSRDGKCGPHDGPQCPDCLGLGTIIPPAAPPVTSSHGQAFLYGMNRCSWGFVNRELVPTETDPLSQCCCSGFYSAGILLSKAPRTLQTGDVVQIAGDLERGTMTLRIDAIDGFVGSTSFECCFGSQAPAPKGPFENFSIGFSIDDGTEACLRIVDGAFLVAHHVEPLRAVSNHLSRTQQLQVLERLLSLHPESATLTDNMGRLPVHYASRSKDYELFHKMFLANPSGVSVADVNGDLPLHFSLGNDNQKVVESSHPYPDGTDEYKVVEVPGAISYNVSFDDLSATESGYDFVTLYKDDSHSEYWGESKYSGGRGGSDKNFPGCGGRPSLLIPASRFVVYFHSDGGINDWGYKLTATANITASAEFFVFLEKVMSTLLDAFPEAARTANISGDLPLHILIDECGFILPCIELLLKHYPEAVNVRGKKNVLPFVDALDREAPPQVLKMLMPSGLAGLSTPNADECLPLHVASSSSRHDLALLLLKAHPAAASVLTSPNRKKQLPLHLALTAAPCNRLLQSELITALLESYPSGISCADWEGRLPIHIAAVLSVPLTCVRLLLDAGRDVIGCKDAFGNTALHYACNLSPHEVPRQWMKLAGANSNAPGGASLLDLLSETAEDGRRWLQEGPFVSSVRIQVDILIPEGALIVEYGLCSANDLPDRDPVAWTLQGKLFNEENTEDTDDEWVDLHDYSGGPAGSFAGRREWMWFTISCARRLRSVRIEFKAIRRPGESMQVARFRLKRDVSSKRVAVAKTLLEEMPDCGMIKDAAGKTALHLLVTQSFTGQVQRKLHHELINKYVACCPGALREKDDKANTPLSAAVGARADHEVISLLLASMTSDEDAIPDVDKSLVKTALLSNIHRSALEVLLEAFPSLLTEYDEEENGLLLHVAIAKGVSFENIMLLLERLPRTAAAQKNGNDKYPLSLALHQKPGPRIVESCHPYLDNTDSYVEVTSSGAISYNISFDDLSATESGCDFVTLYKDDSHIEYWGESKYSGGRGGSDKNFPGCGGRPSLLIPASRFVVYFHSDGSINDWGYKLTATANFPDGLSLVSYEATFVSLLQALYEANPSVVHDIDAVLPLCRLIADEAPESFLLMLIDKSPDLVAVSDNSTNRLPIHVACAQSPGSVSLISALLKVLPDSVNAKDAEGNLPIHLTCAAGAKFEIIELLLAASPSSARETGNNSKLPLHLAMQSGKASAESLQLLLTANKEAAFLPIDESMGTTPLHWSVNRHTQISKKLLIELIHANPDAIVSKNSDGNTPFCEAITAGIDGCIITEMLSVHPQCAAIADQQGLLPLHVLFMANHPSLSLILPALLAAYPAAAAIRQESDGRLPIHLACASKLVTSNVVQALLAAHPDGAYERDNSGRLPITHAIFCRAGVTTVESSHPYPDGTDEYKVVEVSGAISYNVSFDDLSATESLYDFVTLYKDDSHSEYWGESKYSGGRGGSDKNFPGCGGRPSLLIPASRFVVYFHSDGSNNDWGYKLTALPQKQPLTLVNFDNSDHRSSSEEEFDKVIQLLLDKAISETSSSIDSQQMSVSRLQAADLMCAGLYEDIVIALLAIPTDLTAVDSVGRTVLHHACAVPMSADILTRIAQASPPSLRIFDADGNLPVHLALNADCGADTLKELLSLYPESIYICSRDGLSLFAKAIRQYANYSIFRTLMDAEDALDVQFTNSGNERLIFDALHWRAPEKLLQELLRARPGRASERNRMNELPLHKALQCGASPSFIAELLRINPQSVRECDLGGNLPLHDLVQKMSRKFVIESSHPYTCDMIGSRLYYVGLNNALEYSISFDERTQLQDCASFTFYKDFSLTESLGEGRYRGGGVNDVNRLLPGLGQQKALTIPARDFVVCFRAIDTRESVTYTENTNVVIGDANGTALLTIISAKYHQKDVTDTIKSLVADRGAGKQLILEGEGNFFNEFFGDPAPGVLKSLTVVYDLSDTAVLPGEATDRWGFSMTISATSTSRVQLAGASNRITDLNKVITAFPEGVNVANTAGSTPLIIAISGKATNDTVLALLAACPAAAAAMDPGTKLFPLHAALKENYPTPVIWKLLDANPEAASVSDDFGCTPLHSVCCGGAFYEISLLQRLLELSPSSAAMKDSEGRFALHCALRSGAPLNFVETLVNANPSSASFCDTHCLTPLHYACYQLSPSASLVELLLATFPEAAQQVDINGRLPLHCLLNPNPLSTQEGLASIVPQNSDAVGDKRVAALTVAGGNYVTNRSIADTSSAAAVMANSLSESTARYDICKLLLQRFKEAASRPDMDGSLPLHRVLDYDLKLKQSVDLALVLLDAYPEVASIAPPSTIERSSQTLMSPICSNGHQMIQTPTDIRTNCSCNVCGASRESGVWWYCPQQCDYDLCTQCSDSSTSVYELPPVCASYHCMEVISPESRTSSICHGCGRVHGGGQWWACLGCDFDYCANCGTESVAATRVQSAKSRCRNEHCMRLLINKPRESDSRVSCGSCGHEDLGADGTCYFYCPQCNFALCPSCCPSARTNGLRIDTKPLPLHICIEKDAPLELLMSLLTANPSAAKMRYEYRTADGKGVGASLSIHRALLKSSPCAFMLALIEACPTCSKELDGFSRTPLHVALLQRASSDIFKTMLAAHPSGAAVADSDGRLPLHLLFTGENNPIELLEPLLAAYPAGAAHKDGAQGKLPIHYAAACLQSSAAAIAALVAANPEGCRECDNSQMLPLHHAVSVGGNQVIVESEHPYNDDCDRYTEVCVLGATSFTITFDPRSATEPNYDFVTFYKDETHTEVWGDSKYSGTSNWPGVGGMPSLNIASDKFIVYFHSDGSRTDWGYRICVVAKGLEESADQKKVADIVAVLLASFSGACLLRAADGKVPLMTALDSGASLQVCLQLLNACPESASLPFDGDNKLLLSVALERSLPKEFITAIVAANPAALHRKDEDGRLPLHVAIYHNIGIDVIRCLLDSHPNAAVVRDKLGQTPYHAALNTANSDDTLRALLEYCPQGATVKELKTNRLPLYYAMKVSSTDVLVLLITANPGSASERGDNGQLPLHSAVEKGLAAEVVAQLLTAFPDGAKTYDKAQMLPLHYAVSVKYNHEVIWESAHPYTANIDEYLPIEAFGATSYLISFDELSTMESGNDYITFYKDDSHTDYWGEMKYTGGQGPTNNNYPGLGSRAPLVIPAKHFVAYFHSDSSCEEWGYKVRIGVQRALSDAAALEQQENVVRMLLDAHPSAASTKLAKLGVLPIFACLDNDCPSSIMQMVLTAFPAAARERSRDGHLPLHYIIQKKCPSSVVYASLSEVMPITRLGEPVEARLHDFWWTHILSSTADMYADVVDKILIDYVQHVEKLAECKDPDGRKALDIATLQCKRVILSHIYFFGRYELKAGPAEHQSATCIVRLAVDHNDDNSRVVALKFMRNRDQFDRELNIRKLYDLSADYVLGALHSHDGDADPNYREELSRRGYGLYPYCLVLPAADRNLSSMLVHERIAGREWIQIRSICLEIAKALGHMHSKGLIHGDVKPLNIMRMGSRFLLIDLDATVSFQNGGFIGAKYSSAYLPPEMLFIDPENPTGLPIIKTYETDPGTGLPLQDKHRKFQLLQAHVTQDMWSFGMTLFHMCAGVPFFRANDEDNIDTKQLVQLAEWNEEFKLERLNEVKDRHARNLLRRLLHKDPQRRPQNIEQVLKHPFLSGSKPVRMEGEEAAFDIFISYRVASDASHAERMYNLLTGAGLRVWWDKKCLEPGMDWEQGFCNGLARSRNFLCLLSRGAIKHDEKAFNNYEKLTKDSPVDNVLLEQRMALELRSLGLIDGIFPIMIGDMKPDGTYSDYFQSGCHPTPPDEVVVSVEKLMREHFGRLELELPSESDVGRSAGLTVRQTLQLLLKNQGGFLKGSADIATLELRDAIVKMCRGHAVMDKTAHSTDVDGATVVALREEIQRLNRLLAERDRQLEAQRRAYNDEVESIQRNHIENTEQTSVTTVTNNVLDEATQLPVVTASPAVSRGGKRRANTLLGRLSGSCCLSYNILTSATILPDDRRENASEQLSCGKVVPPK